MRKVYVTKLGIFFEEKMEGKVIYIFINPKTYKNLLTKMILNWIIKIPLKFNIEKKKWREEGEDGCVKENNEKSIADILQIFWYVNKVDVWWFGGWKYKFIYDFKDL